MNRARWNSHLPIAILALKLSEEASEVGTLVSDAWKNDAFIDVDRMNEELDHVEFIASLIRTKVAHGV